jgi:hypothetical protein
MHHKIKSHPEQFQAVLNGDKKHEVRKFDRDYKQGDYVTLQEWDPASGKYTGREIQIAIYNVTAPGTFGLPADIGCFTIAVIPTWRSPASEAPSGGLRF